MKKLLLPLATTLTIAAVAYSPAPAPAPAPPASVRALLPASVWDSVYTDSQTVRGDSLYQAVCIKCHGPTLAGTPDGNPLSGADFVANWDGLTIDQIYDKIRDEMPPDNPKTIPHELVPDVLAFILKKNGFPAGAKPLPDNRDTLKTIKFQKAKS
jgi:mono/diheme cytochrome c family protein